jgi:hypothetical protein
VPDKNIHQRKQPSKRKLSRRDRTTQPASPSPHAQGEPRKAAAQQSHDGKERDFNDLSKEEIIALLRKVAAELGHRPNQYEFWQMAGAKKEHMRRLFGSYRELVQEAGFEALGPGYHLTVDQLLEDWAAVTRRLGKAPTVLQYDKAGKYSHRAFRVRWKSWQDVPAAMMEWASAKWPDRKWDDVMEIARKYVQQRKAAGPRKKKYNRLMQSHGDSVRSMHGDELTSTSGDELTSTHDGELTATNGNKTNGNRKKPAEKVYGQPLVRQALATAPTNEAGVMCLFASLATALGFTMLHVQQAFPDCHAFRRGQDGLWRIVRIEFEFESRNFLAHGHDPKGCDLIVCWKHNWDSCPVEVVELSGIVAG